MSPLRRCIHLVCAVGAVSLQPSGLPHLKAVSALTDTTTTAKEDGMYPMLRMISDSMQYLSRRGYPEYTAPGQTESQHVSGAVPTSEWMILLCVLLLCCALDVFLHLKVRNSLGSHVLHLAFWVVAALMYNGLVWSRLGYDFAFQWCSGWFLECLLSFDNLFVFHLIFVAFKVPANQIPTALSFGIMGAVLIRCGFFMALGGILRIFVWMRMPIGLLLIWSGIMALSADEDEGTQFRDGRLVRLLRHCFGRRLLNDYDNEGGSIFVRGSSGELQFTLLFVVLACVELTDVVFAVDSVSAKVAQIPSEFINVSSSAMAMFGLRAAYFIIHDLVNTFELLKYGISAILMLIGLELLFPEHMEISSSTMVVVLSTVFAVCIVASPIAKVLSHRSKSHPDAIINC